MNPAQSFTDTKRRVLVVAPQWVGDAIVSLPLIRQLKKEYAGVDVLAVPAVAAVYQCSPDVNSVRVEAFRHGQLQWGLRREVARSLRGQYDTAIVLPNSWKSALIPWLAGIAHRRGMLGEHRYGLLNERRNPPTLDHSSPTGQAKRPAMLHHYLSLADNPPSVTAIDPFGEHQPQMSIPAQGAALPPDAGLLTLCPGAEYGPAKQWPAVQFAQTAQAWLAMSPRHRVALIGGPKDEAVSAEIVSLIQSDPKFKDEPRRILNLAGTTSLIEAFAWIRASRAVISNDSGLMHAAAALDTAVIAIFGSTDPHHTPPNSAQAQIVSLRLSCSPCFKRACPLGTTACLRDLPAQTVITLLQPFRLDSSDTSPL